MKKQKVRFEKFRLTIKCPKCGEKVRKAEEGHHLAYECTKRLETCSVYEIVLPKLYSDKDFVHPVKSCEEDNPALPCEFCEGLVPADELVSHQKKCLNQEKVEENYFYKGYIGDAFRPSATKSARKENRELNDSTKQRREKTNEVKPEFVVANGRDARVGKICPKSHRESISIIALPCEVCGELCPSDKLMDHQVECQQERETTSQNDPKTAQRPSPRVHESAFKSHDFPQNDGARFIEVQRSYSPTIEFKDDESLEDDIGSYFPSRDERSSINFPPSSNQTFYTTGDVADVSGVRYVEFQRSYSPVMVFEEENVSEMFTHDIATFLHTRDPSRSFQHSNPSRFNQADSRFWHGRN